MSDFNSNSIGIPNGNYFALPSQAEDSALVLVSAPWDVTTSYRPGASQGPQAILNASAQIDLYDLDNGEAWTKGIGTIPISDEILEKSKKTRAVAEQIIMLLEEGAAEDDPRVTPLLTEVNKAAEQLNQYVYNHTKKLLDKGHLVGLVGGDHSTPFGFVKALSEKYTDFGVLHVDAHADLREAYEGFEFSHASIMYNIIKHIPQVSNLVQVGVRDLCKDELDLANESSRIHMFNDYFINNELFNGKLWAHVCGDIIAKLPQKVYVSFDIDGLSPDNCPGTGTPVPGGLSFHQANFLIKQLVQMGKTIVGFDLCEVSPTEESEWDATVGARILYKLCGYCIRSQEAK
ncbi:MAG: agmatinase family protein [Prevotellaceae bacterium]|jgi:agmatinase|nr:agmatinase family protein [Prevotellaceae bacterium]